MVSKAKKGDFKNMLAVQPASLAAFEISQQKKKNRWADP